MQQTTVIEKNVQDYEIDPKIGAVKLIEALLEMGKINQATYTNIMKHVDSHISQTA